MELMSMKKTLQRPREEFIRRSPLKVEKTRTLAPAITTQARPRSTKQGTFRAGETLLKHRDELSRRPALNVEKARTLAPAITIQAWPRGTIQGTVRAGEKLLKPRDELSRSPALNVEKACTLAPAITTQAWPRSTIQGTVRAGETLLKPRDELSRRPALNVEKARTLGPAITTQARPRSTIQGTVRAGETLLKPRDELSRRPALNVEKARTLGPAITTQARPRSTIQGTVRAGETLLKPRDELSRSPALIVEKACTLAPAITTQARPRSTIQGTVRAGETLLKPREELSRRPALNVEKARTLAPAITTQARPRSTIQGTVRAGETLLKPREELSRRPALNVEKACTLAPAITTQAQPRSTIQGTVRAGERLQKLRDELSRRPALKVEKTRTLLAPAITIQAQPRSTIQGTVTAGETLQRPREELSKRPALNVEKARTLAPAITTQAQPRSVIQGTVRAGTSHHTSLLPPKPASSHNTALCANRSRSSYNCVTRETSGNHPQGILASGKRLVLAYHPKTKPLRKPDLPIPTRGKDRHVTKTQAKDISGKINGIFNAVKPINIHQEKSRFFKSAFKYNPQFEYASPALPDVLAECSIASDKFLTQAVGIMQRVLMKYGSYENFEKVTGGRILPKSQVLHQIQNYMERERCLGEIAVDHTSDILSRACMSVRNGRATMAINVSAVREHWLEGMLRHEIGTHYFRSVNNRQQPWYDNAGRDTYDLKPVNPTEEGLASIHSVLCDKDPFLWRAALLYYTVYQASRMSFCELFQDVAQFVEDPNTRWDYCMRAKRGCSDTSQPGCFNKDQVYLDGILHLLRHRDTIDFRLLTCMGKVSYEDITRLKRFAVCHTSRIPLFLKDRGRYMKHLEHIMEVNGLTDKMLRKLIV